MKLKTVHLLPVIAFAVAPLIAHAQDAAPAAPATPAAPANRGLPSPLGAPFPGSDYTGPTVGVPDDVPDYPLQQWLNDCSFGKDLKNDRIKVYGWIDVGANISTSKQSNVPDSYDVVPNSVQLDQFVLRVERAVDTVQTSDVDWGFRVSGFYGIDYRYTIATGQMSQQLLDHNSLYGYDIPEAYFLLYFPQIADGMLLKVGHFISPPDIEAQLAPDNYLYSHSTMFTYDPYTFYGFEDTVKLNKNWQVQFGLNGGNDVAPWQEGNTLNAHLMVRVDSDDVKDSLFTGFSPIGLTKDAGKFQQPGTPQGHDDLQGYFATWSHKFSDTVNMATEGYVMWQWDAVVGGTVNNGPIEPYGSGGGTGPHISGMANAYGLVNYLNFKLTNKDYISFRNDLLDDPEGWRTGAVNTYTTQTLGWVHNLSDLVTFRPEIKYEHAWNNPAYDNYTKRDQVVLSADVIVRF